MSDGLAELCDLAARRPPYVVYRRHNCQAAHRTYARAARCIWHKPRHDISGDGPYAFVETFYQGFRGYSLSIKLFSSLSEAEKRQEYAASLHAAGGCCGSCTGQSKIVILGEAVARGVRRAA